MIAKHDHNPNHAATADVAGGGGGSGTNMQPLTLMPTVLMLKTIITPTITTAVVVVVVVTITPQIPTPSGKVAQSITQKPSDGLTMSTEAGGKKMGAIRHDTAGNTLMDELEDCRI